MWTIGETLMMLQTLSPSDFNLLTYNSNSVLIKARTTPEPDLGPQSSVRAALGVSGPFRWDIRRDFNFKRLNKASDVWREDVLFWSDAIFDLICCRSFVSMTTLYLKSGVWKHLVGTVCDSEENNPESFEQIENEVLNPGFNSRSVRNCIVAEEKISPAAWTVGRECWDTDTPAQWAIHCTEAEAADWD